MDFRLDQIDGFIDFYHETDDFAKRIEYFRCCEKWFQNAGYKVICMMNDDKDELDFIQNPLPLEYCNITFKITKYLIEQEYRKFETTIMEIAETIPDGNEKELILKKLYELITLMQNCALQVLDYKLY